MAKLGRRLLASGNILATIVLLGVLFIMVNYLSSQRYARWDLTRQKFTALSGQTIQTLKGLQAPLSVIVFYQPMHPLYGLVKDCLEEYARVSPRIQVEYVDPVQDVARAKRLVQDFQIDVEKPDALSLVIFQSGSRHKYLSDTDLAEYDYGSMSFGSEPRVKTFKGETAFTSAIISVTQAKQPLVWFTSGHGEQSVETQTPAGLSELKRSFEQHNIRMDTVTLLERSAIPPEVKLVIITGPTHRFAEQEAALLATYLERGGRLLALIDPLENTGLDGLLTRWGIELGMDIVVDPSRQLPFVSPGNLLVTTYTQHPIVEKMKTLLTLFPLARSVRPAEPAPQGLTVTPLAMTSEAGWGETRTSVEEFRFKAGEDVKGPVSIAVASERSTPTQTRLVVIGDSDFIANGQLGNAGNLDLVHGAVYWLMNQEQLIGVSPKPIQALKLNLTGGQLKGLLFLSLLAMPLLCGVAGAGTWWLRRT